MSDIDPTTGLVLVAVFAAFALGLSSFALWLAVSARHGARDAVDAVRAVAARLPRTGARRPAPEAPEPRVERRERDLGPPQGQPERRRHRAPDDMPRARRRDVDDPQYRIEPEVGPSTPSGSSSANDATREHPAPSTTYRRPPPPLPRPGAIGRPQ